MGKSLRSAQNYSITTAPLWQQKDGLTHFCKHYKPHRDLSGSCNRNSVFNSWLIFHDVWCYCQYPHSYETSENINMLQHWHTWGPIFAIVSVEKIRMGKIIFPYHHSGDKSLYPRGKHLIKHTHHHNPALLTGGLREEAGQGPADIRWSLLLLTI